MLDVMAGMTVTWGDLNERWPWSRVLMAHDAIVRARYYAAHPTAFLHSTFISANLKKGRRAPKPHELLLPGAVPPEIRRTTTAKAAYSEAVVTAFTLARSLGFTGNAHLAAFGSNELRASGWERGDGQWQSPLTLKP